MKLKVHIDSKGYKQKPTSKEVGGIKHDCRKIPVLPLSQWQNW